MPFTAASRYLDAEKLNVLKRVSEQVCAGHAIPANSKTERDSLAHVIIVASASLESEERLLEAARREVSHWLTLAK